MATRIKARSSDLYEQDLYAWSKAQADLLRASRFGETDLEHLIEEIEDVGGSLYRLATLRGGASRASWRSSPAPTMTEAIQTALQTDLVPALAR